MFKNKSDGFQSLVSQLSKNEKNLLDIIWRQGPISRKSLASEADITGASATRLTKNVLLAGLVEESIEREGSVGNPSKPLQRAKNGFYSIGVTFNKNIMSVGIANTNGLLVDRFDTSVDAVTLDKLSSFIIESLKTCKVIKNKNTQILGVGVAIPGYRAKEEDQWAIHWDFPCLNKINIEDELSKQLGLPVYAERDAIAAMWAERLNGTTKQFQDFCMLYLAQGVGGAIMSNGLLHQGFNGNAGGFGTFFGYDKPRPSAQSLCMFLEPYQLTYQTLDETNEAHMTLLDYWLKEITPVMKESLNIITRLFDPEVIVLGGVLPNFVLNRMIGVVNFKEVNTTYTAQLPAPEIIAANGGDNSLLEGAATLPLAKLLQ